jgi:prepilin-type N-terminal cleavage/methylation domain-containing protein
MMVHQTPTGFTLVELLVVVTMIVVLMAMLAPALDQAIYRAELVQCAARQAGITTSVQLYAMGHKRIYPALDPFDAGVQPANIKGPVGGGGPGNSDPFDYRPKVRAYMPVNNLHCPMAGTLDLEDDSSVWIWTTYEIRAGFGYFTKDGLGAVTGRSPGMWRIGDRWQFTDTQTDPGKPTTYDFNIVVGDIDRHTDTDRSAASHPDRGDAANLILESYRDPLYIYNLWVTKKDGVMRTGLLDANWAYQDGSAGTVAGIKPHPQVDERMARIPAWGNGNNYKNAHYSQVPRP